MSTENIFVQFCKALADPTRSRLLALLIKHELNVGELVQVMEMGQSRVSRHLKILSDCNLVSWRKDGQWTFYRGSTSPEFARFLQVFDSMISRDDLICLDLERAKAVLEEREARVRRFFDDNASKWEKLNKEIFGELDIFSEILSRIPDCACAADLGCGPGILLQKMMSKSKQVIGVDTSQRMLELARERIDSVRASLRIGDLEYLPLRDAESDCSVMCMVLHHLADPEAGVLEAARTVRAGGRLIIVDFMKHSHEPMRTDYQDRWLGFSGEQLDAWMRLSGLEPVPTDFFKAAKGLQVGLFQGIRPALAGI